MAIVFGSPEANEVRDKDRVLIYLDELKEPTPEELMREIDYIKVEIDHLVDEISALEGRSDDIRLQLEKMGRPGVGFAEYERIEAERLQQWNEMVKGESPCK